MLAKGLGEIPERQIFVYFRADWSELVRNYEADAIMIVNEDVRGMFLITDHDRGMFVIIYSPSQEESAQDYTAERCKSMILSAIGKPDMAVEIVDMAHWQPIQRVADRFQEGRVFLVGDAAHTMPPKMGLGVNTAIQSAQNLAWKLSVVLKGNATPQLLATYRIGADADLFDLENGWQMKMGVSAEGAVLVRPDGFVAWRSRTLQTIPRLLLEQALARILCRPSALLLNSTREQDVKESR